MSIRYDLPRGQFFDEEHRYVNPGTVAEKLRQAESEAVKWEARQRSTEQKLGYEEKLRGQAEADLAAMTKREKVAAMFGDAFEDAAKGCHWMLEYERGLNHVIVSNWQYASQADEAFSDGYEAARMDAEEQYEPRLAAAREEIKRLNDICDRLAAAGRREG